MAASPSSVICVESTLASLYILLQKGYVAGYGRLKPELAWVRPFALHLDCDADLINIAGDGCTASCGSDFVNLAGDQCVTACGSHQVDDGSGTCVCDTANHFSLSSGSCIC